MSKIADDTRGGFNTFLEEQRDEDGTATVSLYDFDSDVSLVYENKIIEDAAKLDGENHRPGGKTALHDALTMAIDDTIDNIEAAEEPDNVIVVALTDGKENASETPAEAVRERVEECREERGVGVPVHRGQPGCCADGETHGHGHGPLAEHGRQWGWSECRILVGLEQHQPGSPDGYDGWLRRGGSTTAARCER
jgi:hypothetical protein